MTRSSVAAVLLATLVINVSGRARVPAQGISSLAGRWTLNRELSQLPPEIGFGFVPSGVSGADSTGGGGGGRGGSGGAAGFPLRRESEDDARRVQQLTAEVRNPSAHLTIVESPAAVTITDDRGRSRTFHPDGKEEALSLDGVPVAATAKWEASRLVVVYKVEEGRQLRYTYSATGNPAQLVVDVKFIEKAGGDSARRIYEPGGATEPPPSPPAAPSAAPPAAPPPDRVPSPIGAQRPDEEFKGLTKLGVVVEGLSPQAAACGLAQDAIETMVAKSLTDAGLTVRRNSDEDTYVYVNIITASVPSGLCISRYDAFLYTHTTATLSYQSTPVLVQVSLLHQGGITAGAPTVHADGVVRAVKQYVDRFAARIRDANK